MYLIKSVCICLLIFVTTIDLQLLENYDNLEHYCKSNYQSNKPPDEFYCMELEWCSENECCNHKCGFYPENTTYIKIGRTAVVPKKSFSQSANLLYIYGASRDIKVLASESFIDLPNIVNIHLQFNTISYIHHDTFVNSSVSLLDLSWNKIKYIEEGSFDSLYNLKSLKLSHNELEAFHPFPLNSPLEKLILSYNYLNRLAVGSKRYPNLVELDLSFNNLNSLALSSEKHMEKLDLTGNNLESLNVFNIVKIAELRIPLNQFTFTPKNEFQYPGEDILNKIGKISLYPNPWSCQDLNKIGETLLKNNVTLIKTIQIDDIEITRNEKFPICLQITRETAYLNASKASLENFRKLSQKIIDDKRESCEDDRDCAGNLICRRRQCFDPCKEKVCDVQSACQVSNHTFTCNCPTNYRRNPLDLYSRCYIVECFTDRDCPGWIECNKVAHICEYTTSSKKEVDRKQFLLQGGSILTVHRDQTFGLLGSGPIRYPWYYDKDDPGLGAGKF